MVKGRMREEEEFSILNRHLFFQNDFSLAVLNGFQLVSVQGGEETQPSQI